MILRILKPILAIAASVSFHAKADLPHFTATTIRQVDARGWQIIAPVYVLEGKSYFVTQSTSGLGNKFSRNLCVAFGFEDLRTKEITPLNDENRSDFIVFNDDTTVDSIYENEFPSPGRFWVWKSVICVK